MGGRNRGKEGSGSLKLFLPPLKADKTLMRLYIEMASFQVQIQLVISWTTK